MLNQKEGVYSCFVELFGNNINGTDITREQRSELVDFVATEIFEGRIEFSSDAKTKYNTHEKVRTYTVGLVNNWIRKDTRLNGGTKYEVKNPGSRGSSDEVLKNLKALKANLTEAAHIEAVDAKIAERIAELDALKPQAAKKTVDVSKIPADIKAMLGL